MRPAGISMSDRDRVPGVEVPRRPARETGGSCGSGGATALLGHPGSCRTYGGLSWMWWRDDSPKVDAFVIA
jgi:hypothetical protein